MRNALRAFALLHIVLLLSLPAHSDSVYISSGNVQLYDGNGDPRPGETLKTGFEIKLPPDIRLRTNDIVADLQFGAQNSKAVRVTNKGTFISIANDRWLEVNTLRSVGLSKNPVPKPQATSADDRKTEAGVTPPRCTDCKGNGINPLIAAAKNAPSPIPPCAMCSHITAKELKDFSAITKTGEEICNTVDARAKCFDSLETMKKVSAVSGIPVAYIACSIREETKFKEWSSGGGYYKGAGHFGASTAANTKIMDRTYQIASAAGVANFSRGETYSRVYTERFDQMTMGAQISAIAANASYVLDHSGTMQIQSQNVESANGKAMLNLMLMATCGHNKGHACPGIVPIPEIAANNINWEHKLKIEYHHRHHITKVRACMLK